MYNTFYKRRITKLYKGKFTNNYNALMQLQEGGGEECTGGNITIMFSGCKWKRREMIQEGQH